ncbi:hypothetical protein [Actinoplanes subglobosus]|uniref:PH domain-containing protein n=1 Tax=Actinoplanes subglobosus TaxID=1547892 RepID=A0ABV8J2H2_9ACTN
MPDTTLVVRPDRARFKRLAAVTLPVAIPALLYVTLMVAHGRRTSEGLHGAAVPAMLVVVGLPLVWFAVHAVLLVRNAAIRVTDGVVEVRRWTGRGTVIGRPTEIWLLHVDSSGTGARWYLLAGPERAVLLNAGHWLEDGMQEVVRATVVIMTKGGKAGPKELRRRFPGLRMPWYVRFPLPIVTLWFVGAILYLGVVVNVFARL